MARTNSSKRVRATGYEIACADFRRLTETPECRDAVGPLLVDWFGYTIAEDGSDVWVKNRAGEAIDLNWLHTTIQADAVKQHTLYQTAMSLWR